MECGLRVRAAPKSARYLLLVAYACSIGVSAQVETGTDVLAEKHAESGSSFVFIPYPITEPAVGVGLLAGPVWMREGPEDDSGPKKPQAFGAGALWTDGGSR